MRPKRGVPSARWALRQAESLLFFCPSCSQRLGHSPRSRPFLSPSIFSPGSTTRRRISSHTSPNYYNQRPASSSAVDVPRTVPPKLTELYNALAGVRQGAATHVNASRLQLALRGLESEKPVIRVAVLGLGDATTSARLIRLLLADPLGKKADWEDYLEKYHADNGNGILIKYSEKTEIGTPDSFVPTIAIPSVTLKNANIQIYISSLATGAGARATPSSLYIPTISVPTSSSGNQSFVRYPVHRAIVCGKGIDDLLTYERVVGGENLADPEATRAVFELDMPQTPQRPQASGGVVSFVDMSRAENALEKFRQSAQNASEYESGWSGSGLGPLVDWLSKDHSQDPIHADVRRVVESILNTAEKNVLRVENEKVQEQKALTVSDDIRHSLGDAVSTWSEKAHTELRDELSKGFMSDEWRSLAWWKLFWRVDDVGMLASSILEKKWLSQAEKEAIWLSGKIQQAGLLTEDVSEFGQREPSPNEPATAVQEDLWAAHIGSHRNQLISAKVPSLHSLAQKLVAFSLSTSTLTSTLGILTFISTSSTSIYEAGTIAALGLIYSLRRQQKRWDEACLAWESEVQEEGRKALKDTEDAFRVVLKDGGRRTGPVEESEARAAIEKAKEALSSVK